VHGRGAGENRETASRWEVGSGADRGGDGDVHRGIAATPAMKIEVKDGELEYYS
jgi:hypothetical protein